MPRLSSSAAAARVDMPASSANTGRNASAENYDNNVVTGFNSNRADTLASIDRVKQIAENLKATVIIQHDPRDVDKLPAFPASAK
jgi:hypothetical protein